jgi:hypothetical protein
MSNKIFTTAISSLLFAILESHCSEGDGMPAKELHEEAGLEDPEIKSLSLFTIKDIVKATLSDRIGVRGGPNGGYYLIGVEARSSGVAAGLHRSFSEEEVERVKSIVEDGFKLSGGKPMATAFILGRLNMPGDPGHVTGCLAHLPQYVLTKKGVGRVPPAPKVQAAD